MKIPLIPEEGDPTWEFVGNVLRIFDKRKARQIVSKHGIKPLSDSIAMLKIVLLAMCFETDITFVISELRGKASLREFTSVHDVPDAEDIYRILSRFTLDQFMNMVLRIVNTVYGKRKMGNTITCVCDLMLGFWDFSSSSCNFCAILWLSYWNYIVAGGLSVKELRAR
jgi:hypothetical protein